MILFWSKWEKFNLRSLWTTKPRRAEWFGFIVHHSAESQRVKRTWDQTEKNLGVSTLSINNESPLFFYSLLLLWQLWQDSTRFPLMLQIAWPVPNYCHNTTDCSVTAVLLCFHLHSSSVMCSFPSPRCTDLAAGVWYGRLSHQSHIPNVPTSFSEASVAVAAVKAE